MSPAPKSARAGFSAWLHQQLQAHHWNQRDLARAAGVSQQTVSRWLLGRSAPSLNHVPALAGALDISTEELMDRLAPASRLERSGQGQTDRGA